MCISAEVAALRIIRYSETRWPVRDTWPREIAEEDSIGRWIVGELVECITTHPFDDAIDKIEEFAFKLYAYASYKKGTPEAYIFHAAANFVQDILDECFGGTYD